MKKLISFITYCGLLTVLITTTAQADQAETLAACKGGDKPACLKAVSNLIDGRNGAQKNLKEAFAIITPLCEKENYIEACMNKAFISNHNLPEERRFKPVREACEQNNYKACHTLGSKQVAVADTPQQAQKGMKYLKIACDEGNYGKSCAKAGEHYEFEKQGNAAAQYYLKACDLKQEDSCATVGSWLMEGKHVERDYARATKVLTPLCTEDNIYWDSKPCYYLGLIHQNGHGTDKDTASASAYFTRGCEESGEESDPSCKALKAMGQ